MKRFLIIALLFCLFLSSCSFRIDIGKLNPQRVPMNQTGKFDENKSPVNNAPLVDGLASQIDTNVKALYITIYPGKSDDGKKTFAFADVKNSNSFISEKPNVEVIVREGLIEGGPKEGMFGYAEQTPNAKLVLMGAGDNPQHSYKIRLYDKAGTWQNQRVINLSKNFGDFSRMKEKFAYDLLKNVPDMIAFKTIFIQVYIRDLSKQPQDKYYSSIGLYTHIEQPNKQFLKQHGLNSEGTVLQARDFDFSADPKVLQAQNHAFDKSLFEKALTIEQGKETEKFAKMLKDLNTGDFNKKFAQYFNRDNYLTFLAFNILMGNADCATRNYLLYSPQNSTTWYFIPCNLDKILYSKSIDNPERIIPDSMYAGGIFFRNQLHNHFLSDAKNMKDLDAKIAILQNRLSSQSSKALLSQTIQSVAKFVFSMPDLQYLPNSANLWERYTSGFINTITENAKKYEKARSAPLPFILHKPVRIGENVQFSWQTSKDLQGDNVLYELVIASDATLKNEIGRAIHLKKNSYVMVKLPKGKYFWRVIAKDAQGNAQMPVNEYVTEFGDLYSGIEFYIDQ